MILEGVVTTVSEAGGVNISPMGPRVDLEMTMLQFRPYRASETYRNLRRTGQGVFHVTDDVELLARAAVDRLVAPPRLTRAEAVDGWILADACRWYAFRVASVDDAGERPAVSCQVADQGRLRDFFGFNRAKHAVVEAAILASRARWLPARQIRREFRRLAVLVEKTAGPQERRAFQFLDEFVRETVGV